MKYTAELLREHVATSISIAEVLRKMGLRQDGGTHSHISRRIKKFDIDTSHFLGQRANSGVRHKGAPKSRTPEEILVLTDKDRREDTLRLRRALKDIGREAVCTSCGLGEHWNGKPINLQINHINGMWNDNRPSNLEFLCPNCHSQTPTWCRKKKHGPVVESADTPALEAGAH